MRAGAQRASVAARSAKIGAMTQPFQPRSEPSSLLTRRLFLAAAALPLAGPALASPTLVEQPRLLNIPTAKLMQAELYGSDFEVYPKGPIQRTVLPTIMYGFCKVTAGRMGNITILRCFPGWVPDMP